MLMETLTVVTGVYYHSPDLYSGAKADQYEVTVDSDRNLYIARQYLELAEFVLTTDTKIGHFGFRAQPEDWERIRSIAGLSLRPANYQ